MSGRVTAEPGRGIILLTGGSGLIGTALRQSLASHGYQVLCLSRRDSNSPFYYDQASSRIHLDPSVPLTGVINLAGVNISDGRWSERRKREIVDSRVVTTRLLSEALAVHPQPPAVLLSASAIGYYGDTANHTVTESSPAGDGFLARLSVDWEKATAAAQAAGIRTVLLRFGLVLSPAGGLLSNLILPLRLAVVGSIGDGSQYMSWISIADVERIVLRALEQDSCSGALNLVAPGAVTNSDFSRSLARALGRPRLPPLPAPVVRLMFGEMADAALLASSRVASERLTELEVELQYPQLDQALAALLGPASASNQ